MDAAKLHDVVIDIDNEYKNYEIEDKFSGLVGTLQRLVGLSGDQETPHTKLEEELAARLAKINEALTSAPSNDFRPSQVKVLKRIGGEDWTGRQLYDRIASALESETIQSQSVVKKLKSMLEDCRKFKANIRQLRDAMDELNVPIVSLGGNETEMGFLLPMETGEVRLRAIYEEFETIDHHLKHLSEVTGNRLGSVRVRAISTNSVELFVGGTLATGLTLATIIEKLTNAYKTVQEIRLHHREIRERDEQLDYLTEEDIEGVIDRKLDEIRDEVIAYAPDSVGEGRLNELRKPVKDALKYFGDRIDGGAEIEVNVLLPSGKTPEEEEEEVDVPGWESFRELHRRGGVMARFTRADRKIMGLERAGELPEPEDEGAEEGAGEVEAEVEPDEEGTAGHEEGGEEAS